MNKECLKLTEDLMEQGATLEVCVDSLELAQAAALGGADRIELCGPLYDGGITPSAGLAIAARRAISLPIAMLVRPHTRGFTASREDFEVMRQDIQYARSIGMDMVVLGILHDNHTVDVERTRELVKLASPMEVTFHRAFDATHDLTRAIEGIIQTGATRILTSGAKPSALTGAETVGELNRTSDGRIGLLLCGGIHVETVRLALERSGAREVHAALRSSRPKDGMSHKDPARFSESVRQLKRAIG